MQVWSTQYPTISLLSSTRTIMVLRLSAADCGLATVVHKLTVRDCTWGESGATYSTPFVATLEWTGRTESVVRCKVPRHSTKELKELSRYEDKRVSSILLTFSTTYRVNHLYLRPVPQGPLRPEALL